MTDYHTHYANRIASTMHSDGPWLHKPRKRSRVSRLHFIAHTRLEPLVTLLLAVAIVVGIAHIALAQINAHAPADSVNLIHCGKC